MRVMTDLEWDKLWERLHETVSFANKERIEALEAENERLRKAFRLAADDNICLNCGRLTPCELHGEETAPPGTWSGSPCTFDIPALAEMRERAENAETKMDAALDVCRALIDWKRNPETLRLLVDVVSQAEAALLAKHEGKDEKCPNPAQK